MTNKVNNIDKYLGYDYDSLKKSINLNYSQYSGSIISTKLFIKILCSIFTIKQETVTISGNRNVKYYKLNKYKDVYQDYNIRSLGQDIMLIADALDYNGNEIKFVIKNVLYQLNISNFNNLGIKTINHSPKELIKFNNGILNIKTKEFHQKGSDQYYNILNKYDFVNAFDFNYLTDLDDNNQYILVYNKLIKDLANNKDDQILLFNRLVFSVIEGNGRNKYVILSGKSSPGKTAFGNILLNIAGNDYTRYVTMDGFDDDNSINTLSMSTKLILGDDLQKPAKLAGKSLRYFKTLVDSNHLSVSVKYEPNRIVQTNGLWLQMMDKDSSIYKANDAINDRTVLIKIEDYNHKNIINPMEKEFSKKLDLYTGRRRKADENFIQTVVSYISKEIDYFDEFTNSIN